MWMLRKLKHTCSSSSNLTVRSGLGKKWKTSTFPTKSICKTCDAFVILSNVFQSDRNEIFLVTALPIKPNQLKLKWISSSTVSLSMSVPMCIFIYPNSWEKCWVAFLRELAYIQYFPFDSILHVPNVYRFSAAGRVGRLANYSSMFCF